MQGEAEPVTGETVICDPVLQQPEQLIWSKNLIPCNYYRHCNIYLITNDLKDARDSSRSYIQLLGESSLVSYVSVPQNKEQFWQEGLMDISMKSQVFIVTFHLKHRWQRPGLQASCFCMDQEHRNTLSWNLGMAGVLFAFSLTLFSQSFQSEGSVTAAKDLAFRWQTVSAPSFSCRTVRSTILWDTSTDQYLLFLVVPSEKCPWQSKPNKLPNK